MRKVTFKDILDFLDSRGAFNFMPDEMYLRFMFRLRMHRKLNLRNPQCFNDKIQWIKLYDRRPEYTMFVDKYAVKQYIAEKIGGQCIIPTLGVWEKFDDIDFEKLPNKFVLKCTHDSGGLIICKEKTKLDIVQAKKKINKCLKRNYYWMGREWPYKNVPHRIIAEQYMADNNEGLKDYKFYCFNGTPQFLYVSEGMENHATAKISFLTMDWKFASFSRNDYKPFTMLPDKPAHFDEMIEIAKILSSDIPFLRVDLYEINNQIYFSELTFSPCGGFMRFNPDSADNKVGQMLKI